MPLLTLADINHAVKAADFYRFPNTGMTVCRLELDYGFSVLGSSACAVPAEFDEVVGRSLAHADAISKVWELQTFLAVWKVGAGLAQPPEPTPPAPQLLAEPAAEQVVEDPHIGNSDVSPTLPTGFAAQAPEAPAEDPAPEAAQDATGLSFAEVLSAATTPAPTADAAPEAPPIP